MNADALRDMAANVAVAAPETVTMGDGLVLRPLTAGSASLCALAGNRAYLAIVGGEKEKLADVNDYDVTEFLYIHCAPEDETRRAVTSPGLRDKVLKWGAKVDFGVILGARRAIESVKEQLDALKFDVEPQPSRTKDDAPPNS